MISKLDIPTIDFTYNAESASEEERLLYSTAQNDITLLKKRMERYLNKLDNTLENTES